MTKNEKWIIGGAVVGVVLVTLLSLAGVAFLLLQAKPQATTPKPSQTLSVAPTVDVVAAKESCVMAVRAQTERAIDTANQKNTSSAFGSFDSVEIIQTSRNGSTVNFSGFTTVRISSGSLESKTSFAVTCTASLINGSWTSEVTSFN